MDEKKYSYDDFVAIIKRLRAPGGCPWDREQTHESLKPCLINECREVLEGIERLKRYGRAENLCEELGDLLLQVVLHACIAEEEGLFDMTDVTDGVSRKMIYRHPHVFADGKAGTSAEVLKNWEELKAREKQHQPESCPGLDTAQKETLYMEMLEILCADMKKQGIEPKTVLQNALNRLFP